MPVSSVDVNGAAAAAAAVAITALDGESNDGRDGLSSSSSSSSRRLRWPLAWLNMMRACDDVLLEKFRGANSTASTTTTVATAVTAVAVTVEKDGDAAPTEVATSKKCEGQLPSSFKANSCSSCCCCCKSAITSRTTEMAQEDHSGGPSWDNLPSVILQEIFSYLSHESRIKASQVCRNWRYTLFHPSFWRKISFVFKDEDSVSWVRFMADCFALSVHEATIRWDISSRRYIDCMSETYNLLKKLSYNRQLRKLFLEFSCNNYDYSFDNEDDSYYFPISLTECVVKIIETSNHLEALSLGCSEELTANASIILEPLRLHHAKHLTHLSLASIKDDPEYYDLYELDNSIFNSFIRLSILTLDYEYVSDTLLKALDNGCMQRLVIHVHGWKDYPGTTNRAWQVFVQKNPQCELRLNLIHSYRGVKVLDSDILCAAMPLTHLKVLFCEGVNIRALLRLSMWYSHTLKSLTWIDSIDRKQYMPATLDPNDPNSPDPLVLAAWKCTKLTKIVFLGHKYYQENLLAIARLRGSTLQVLAFAKSDITSENESWHKTESITHEIREIMGLHWMPLSDSDLPMVILDPFKGDSREVITPLVLRDQK
ncbi:F-box only protein 33 isoform X2 [Harpegnathos saltator]|uniref:F-box only protein 33 isoform X2 n=1 Tax=Harpegnathos saltator TaxID=610380 RepID=UPI00058B88CB|nr:F-box only protein 33 isoform X2 [Harpegnathos saltator]